MPVNAHALRPFDSTDPAVADFDHFEFEVGPFGYLRDFAARTWVAPQLRINYGISPGWEVVMEGQRDSTQRAGATLAADDIAAKHVLREGSVQDKAGISVATEMELLLPGSGADPGTGASFALIAGEKWGWGSLYTNGAAVLTRDHHAQMVLGQIWEGPDSWRLRPVAEVTYERAFSNSRELAGLVGVLFQANEHWVLDLGLRQSRLDGHADSEVRWGFTYDLPRHR